MEKDFFRNIIYFLYFTIYLIFGQVGTLLYFQIYSDKNLFKQLTCNFTLFLLSFITLLYYKNLKETKVRQYHQ